MNKTSSNDKNKQESSAWLLYVNPETAIALGQFEIVYILKYENHKLKNIDGPVFCNQSISWQDKTVKVLDLDCLINKKNEQVLKSSYDCIVIIPVVQEKGNVMFFGIKIINIPIKIQVNDSQQCNYPENYEWDKLSSSCFYDEKYGTVPILDSTKIFNYLNK